MIVISASACPVVLSEDLCNLVFVYAREWGCESVCVSQELVLENVNTTWLIALHRDINLISRRIICEWKIKSGGKRDATHLYYIADISPRLLFRVIYRDTLNIFLMLCRWPHTVCDVGINSPSLFQKPKLHRLYFSRASWGTQIFYGSVILIPNQSSYLCDLPPPSPIIILKYFKSWNNKLINHYVIVRELICNNFDNLLFYKSYL